jgi:hypothetical protein
MPRRLLPREHGTERGYRQHVTDRTVPCNGCLNGHGAAEQKRRARGRCAPGLGWPLEARRG